MTPNTRTGLMIAALGVLGIAAVAGWTRKPSGPSFGQTGFQTPYAQSFVQPGYPQAGQVAYAAPVGYGQAPYAYPAAYGPIHCAEPMGYSTVAYAPAGAYPVRYVRERPRVVRSSYVERERTYVRRREGRSPWKSVAIVAGTAGTGAAIGALAGGGKGAAIGALAGGAGGFIYDRMTHKN